MTSTGIILTIILAALTIIYVKFLRGIYSGIQQLHKQPRSAQKPFISVIVAARNEEASIEQCIDSLSRQTYPNALYEIIISDDGSSDRTVQRAREATPQGVAFRIVPAGDGARGKAAALFRGIQLARGTIIATTDADCVVPRTWLSTIASFFSPDTVFLAGPVIEKPRSGLFPKLEWLEFVGIIAAGAGLIGSGRPIMCNGANMAFRRSVFDAVGGYGDSGDGNDDEALMGKIVGRDFGRVGFALEPQAIVQTYSENTPWQFFLQRLRWASKQGRYEDPSILVTLVMVYLFFLAVLVTGIVAIGEPILLFPVLVVFAVKIAMERRILNKFTSNLDLKFDWQTFIIAELFHVPYIAITAAVGQFVKTRWK